MPIKTTDINYVELAARIRAAHRRADERRTAGQPVVAPEGKLRLDDIADALAGPETDAAVEKLRAEVEAEPYDMLEPVKGRTLADAVREFAGLRYDTSHSAVVSGVVEALSSCADANGLVDPKVAEKKFGPSCSPLMTRIGELLDHGRSKLPTSDPLHKYEDLLPETRRRMIRSAGRASLADRMPAVAEVSRRFGAPDALSGFSMCSIQHLFPSTEVLYDELWRNGLAREKTVIIGKTYSTNSDLFARYDAFGYQINERSQKPRYGEVKDSAAWTHEAAVEELRRMFKGVDPRETKRRFILLDDGGKLVQALHQDFPKYAHLCTAVEQTDRGIQIIEEMKARGIELKCPVVNIARCQIKKEVEAPMIGASVQAQIDQLGLRVEPREAAVIGYGAIGKATADALRRQGYRVHVFDLDPERQRQAVADGCAVGTREEVLEHGHLLVSCTGRTTIRPAEYDLLPAGAILANAASNNHELGMHELTADDERRTADRQRTVDRAGRSHSTFQGRDILLEQGNVEHRVMTSQIGARRLVLNSGFVVNMGQDIPPEYIQLTRALLLAGVLVAVTADRPGLVDLPGEMQKTIVDVTQATLQRLGLSLQQPDFGALRPAEAE